MTRTLLAAAAVIGLCSGALAQDSTGSQLAQGAADDQALPKGFKTTPLIKSTKTASGMPLRYPTPDKAEMTAVIGELEPGGRTALHQHPAPVLVYVLDGTLTVQAQGGEPRDYKSGQSFLEDINHWHQAFNNGVTPVKILVVFAGEEGKPTSINVK